MPSNLKSRTLLLLAALSLAGCPRPPVPAPSAEGTDWRDQIVYFILTDRFADGDPSNNNQGAGEYDPTKESHYNGGDLRGIADKLDYIRGLGATAVWITPPVANQWWDPWVNYGGYHGYWARHFTQMDEHVGTLEDYKALANKLHDNDMRLIQDIVINHTGNFFRYSSYNPADVSQGFERNATTSPVARAPTQAPFDLNDATNPAHRSANIYHWTPVINQFDNPENRYNYQLSDLDDLNTENPVVRNALKDSYNFWIREVGVDGYRVDTVIFTPPETYADFVRSEDPEHPGVNVFAKSIGKPDFFTFGEAWFAPQAYDDGADRSVLEYLEKDGKPLLDSALGFPLHFTLVGVFAEGRPTRQLGYRLEKLPTLYKDPHRLLHFVDNHDRPRFLSMGSQAALKQALLFIFTIPGIPVVYYGTEQGFTETRSAMFAGGYRSEGKDHFDTSSELYRYINQFSAIRKQNAVFRRGLPQVLQDNGAGPGALAYKLEHEGQVALVLFNTSDQPVLLSEVATGLPEGAELELRVSTTPGGTSRVVGKAGRLSAVLEPRAGQVLLFTGKRREVPPPPATATIDLPDNSIFTDNPRVRGTLQGAQTLKLVVDGNLAEAQQVTAAADGTWSATLVVDGLRPDPQIRHTLVAYVESQNVSSAPRTFSLQLPPQVLVDVADPQGDDKGPSGTYAYPLDASYADRAMDIHRVLVTRQGRNLSVKLTMNTITTAWNPVYGFDHVCFNLYLDVPGREGVAVLPRANAVARDGMKWDYMTLAGGWLNALYSAQGASADNHGTSTGPAPEIKVDKAARTVEFTLSPQALGNPASLSGVRLYITTWDYDNGYRPLVPQPEQWRFSGADGRTAPLIMDDTPVFTLP